MGKLEELRKQYLAAEAAEVDYGKQENMAAEKALGKPPAYPRMKEIPGARWRRSLVGAGIGGGLGGLAGLAALLEGGGMRSKALPVLGATVGAGGVIGGLLGSLTSGSCYRHAGWSRSHTG